MVIQSSNFEIMEKVHEKLQLLTLYDFPGENIDKLCDVQLSILKHMDDAGYLQPEIFSFLTKVWKKITSRDFKSWSLWQHEKVQAWRKLLQFTNPDQVPVDKEMDYEILIKEARTTYLDLIPLLIIGP